MSRRACAMPRHRPAKPRCRVCSRSCAPPSRRSKAIRADQSAKADQLSAIQARYYEAGAEVTRIEQSIEYARELRQRQRSDLEQVDSQAAELTAVVQRDRSQIESLALELATMVPGLDAAHEAERIAVACAGELRARAHRMAAVVGCPRPGGSARPARDPSGTRAHRAIGKSAAAPAAAAGTPGNGAGGVSRNCSRRWLWRS